jgi:hypothetical protein
MVNSPYYDNQYWEYHLPINPPIDPEKDLDMDGQLYEYTGLHAVELNNWLAENGTATYRPRLPIGIDKYKIKRPSRLSAVEDDEEYDCD